MKRVQAPRATSGSRTRSARSPPPFPGTTGSSSEDATPRARGAARRCAASRRERSRDRDTACAREKSSSIGSSGCSLGWDGGDHGRTDDRRGKGLVVESAGRLGDVAAAPAEEPEAAVEIRVQQESAAPCRIGPITRSGSRTNSDRGRRSSCPRLSPASTSPTRRAPQPRPGRLSPPWISAARPRRRR